MTNLMRNQTIRLYPKDNGRFEVRDRRGRVKLADNEEFHIYFKRAEFNEEGFIRGTFLGDTDGKLVNNMNERVFFNKVEGWKTPKGRKFKLARLASVENGSSAVVLIEED